MPQIIVRAGRASEVTSPERREALMELRGRLATGGADVDLEVTEYIPGQRGVTWSETVGLFIAGAVGGGLLANVTKDIYDQAKAWALDRFTKKQAENPNGNPRPESFTIYGPDGEVLKTWKVDREGEHET
jgi:hypothetical protein